MDVCGNLGRRVGDEEGMQNKIEGFVKGGEDKRGGWINDCFAVV